MDTNAVHLARHIQKAIIPGSKIVEASDRIMIEWEKEDKNWFILGEGTLTGIYRYRFG
jgi:hypothetical protein